MIVSLFWIMFQLSNGASKVWAVNAFVFSKCQGDPSCFLYQDYSGKPFSY